jgi:GT2 family glycosyltransferase
MSSKTVAVLSLWRNSEPYIERSLAQFEELQDALVQQQIATVYGFFENDSTDNTPHILHSWLKERIGFVVAERINAPRWGSVASLDRVLYQARYRNAALDLLDNYKYDYLLVADSDIYWKPDLITGMIERLENNSSYGMISPNTTQNVRDFIGDTDAESYFDSWSLLDLDGNQCMTFAANPFLRPEDRNRWDNKQPVTCNSAFGSIAMVKSEALDAGDVYWSVVDGVEHWEFCRRVREAGFEVIADPTLHAQVIHKDEVVPHPEIVRFHQQRLQEFLMPQRVAKS